MDYRAVRTDRYKYIHWVKFPSMGKLYDLERDPFETTNVIADAGMADVRQSLIDELGRLSAEAIGLPSRR